MNEVTGGEKVEPELSRYDNLPRPLKVIFLIIVAIGIGGGLYYNFGWSFLGFFLYAIAYFYIFLAMFCSSVFLILPGRKKDMRLPWYDLLLFVLTFASFFYFYLHSWSINLGDWRAVAGAIPIAILLMVVILEGARRTGGLIYFAIVAIVAVYPLFADYLPGVLWGIGYTPGRLLEHHFFKDTGMLGIIPKVMTELLLGFLVFAGILVATGAGKFFMNLASALLGRYRGGPAKVAVLASGFFGSLSGCPLSNVVATGSFTIPTMKRIGYPAHYAGAIEACASTGGPLMPPVMGIVAFVMCQFLGVEYRVVIMAAAIPAILYYFGLMMQVDAYAARVGLKGLPRQEIPSLRKTLKEGWPFIFVLFFLVWGLVYMRWEKFAPWYASGLMILLSFYRKETMLTPRRIVYTLIKVADLIVRATAIVMPIVFILCSLAITGATLSVTAAMVNLGGENVFFVLLFGVIVCYLMGMAGLLIVAYIFLAVTLAPAVLEVMPLLNVLALHLFIIYYATLADITLPVAPCSFLGATIAEAPPLKTAALSMRLGIVLYFIPFFFIFNPALVLQGSSPLDILYLFPLCLVGIVLIAAGCEGYLLKVGKAAWWARPFLVVSGLLIGFPEWKTTIIGAILASLIIAIMWGRRKLEPGEIVK